MMNTRTLGSERSSTDSVREHRHNLFKYSNIQRYEDPSLDSDILRTEWRSSFLDKNCTISSGPRQ